MCGRWCTVDISAVQMAPRSGQVWCVLTKPWGTGGRGASGFNAYTLLQTSSVTVRSDFVR